MYPGLLDGIQPNCSYTDLWTTAPDVIDCGLLVHYFEAQPAPAVGARRSTATRTRATAPPGTRCSTASRTRRSAARTASCPTSRSTTRRPARRRPLHDRRTTRRRSGARGPRSQWGPVEKKIGRGLREPAMGQRGRAVRAARAAGRARSRPREFVDLNAKIGGLTSTTSRSPSARWSTRTPPRSPTGPAQVIDARQLATVPIIDLRAYTETRRDPHVVLQLQDARPAGRGQRHHDNQLIWTFPAPSRSSAWRRRRTSCSSRSCSMDGWLARIEADKQRRAAGAEGRCATSRPTRRDKCFVGSPGRAGDGGPSRPGDRDHRPAQCAVLYPHYGNTRTAAGGPTTDDIIQCRLKPLDPDGLRRTFTDAQLATLRKAFPDGVCDYTKPGVGEQPSQPWMTFADGPGGRPLGPAPKSTATSCARTSALSAARVKIVRGRKLRVRAPRGAKVAILRHGRRGVRKVARASRDGFYVVRVRLRGETRRFALRRSHGKLRRRPAIERRPSGCATIRSFALDRAAFGRALPLRYRVRRAATARITILRGKRVLRRGTAPEGEGPCRPHVPAEAARRATAARRPARAPDRQARRAHDHLDPDREAPVSILRPLLAAAVATLPGAGGGRRAGSRHGRLAAGAARPHGRRVRAGSRTCSTRPRRSSCRHAVRRHPPRQALLGGRLPRAGRPRSTRSSRSPRPSGRCCSGWSRRAARLSDEDPVTDWIPPDELGAINPQARLAHVLAMVSTNADLRPARRAPGATTPPATARSTASSA